jgi:glutaredoxin
MTETRDDIVVLYGAAWCYASRRARELFDQNKIPYEYKDIDYDPEARKYVEQVNNGYRSVPTIIFPDGSKLVEPTVDALKRKLGVA